MYVLATLLDLDWSVDEGVPFLALTGSHPLRRLLFVLPGQVLQVLDLTLFSARSAFVHGHVSRVFLGGI